jgi:outer membrane protein OmpA-like peptidoglycan-associated protein
MRGKRPSDDGDKAPAWIVAFTSMMLLLMAFFVVLLTMASDTPTGNVGKEGAGQDKVRRTAEGFRAHIESYGLSDWFGAERDIVDMGVEKSYYNTGQPETKLDTTRIIDYREEKIRQTYQKLTEKAKTMKSQIQGARPEFTVLPITFSRGQSVINTTSQYALNKYINDLAGASTSIRTIYVVGLAAEESDETKRWMVSTMRAQAVADYIKTKLPSRFAVYSWGAGAGGVWVGRDSVIPEDSQIAIAVLKDNY